MARYKPIHTGLKLLPVDFDQQVIPGSFEHALCYVVDHELDLTEFHARYKNDDEGAPQGELGSGMSIDLLKRQTTGLHTRHGCLESSL